MSAKNVSKHPLKKNRCIKKKHQHQSIYSIDQYAYLSRIRTWNPTFKVVLSLLTLLLCIISDNIAISISVILSMSYLTIIKGRITLSTYLSLLTIPITFLILGCIPIVVGIANKPFGQYSFNLYWFYLYFTKEDIFKTLSILLKAFGAISAMYMLTLSTPMSEIILVLRKAQFPKIVIELMYLIYRYIFILTDVQHKMKNSAQARLGYCDFKTSCYTFGQSMGNLFVISLKKANAYYDAMEARCYTGELNFLEDDKKVEKRQIIIAFLYFGLLISIKCLMND